MKLHRWASFPPSAGRISATVDGVEQDLCGTRAPRKSSILGACLVPEGRRLFPRLTVEENLLLGAYRQRARRAASARTSTSASRPFPVSPNGAGSPAGSQSGGEQQMDMTLARCP